MIDREKILNQMDGLMRQRREAEDQIKCIDGAMQLCRYWLTEIDRMEAEEKTKAAEDSLKNGELLTAGDRLNN